MKFTPDTRLVDADIARFSAETLEAWRSCLDIILDDPTPRFGTFLTKEVPIREYPSRTWIYDITTELSISGEVVHVFSSETLPDFLVAFVVDERASEIVILNLRPNPRV